ncbi:glutathione S-transferase [Dactylococcopsis salina]|uniref:Glutathione S-transferase n=1 Tax=Dactylococcopsis salina (strain PCC 8305) TaxID=13035 RepID=K9YUB3_DACS8|nr:glutathione S-transferase family protein [Dactylococcopsis salina]AFZ50097.1 glutathione S-transferase [Dactylococcopsis salina PCC 8305]
MLELYQFELSQYSEKVRFLLDYKGLEYRKIEVTPGMGQVEVYQMSGQRQVPVLKDGETVIPDSTDIAMYLERNYPERPLLPTASREKGLTLLMEEWADESIGLKSRKAFIGALNRNEALRTAVLPSDTPDFVKSIVSGIPSDLLDALGTGVGIGGEALKAIEGSLKQDLEALCLILQEQPYLTGATPTLADFSVASLSLLLKFPEKSYMDIPDQLAGKALPGIGDNPAFEPFFSWRDRLYSEYRQATVSTTTSSSSGNAPSSIEIE